MSVSEKEKTYYITHAKETWDICERENFSKSYDPGRGNRLLADVKLFLKRAGIETTEQYAEIGISKNAVDAQWEKCEEKVKEKMRESFSLALDERHDLQHRTMYFNTLVTQGQDINCRDDASTAAALQTDEQTYIALRMQLGLHSDY